MSKAFDRFKTSFKAGEYIFRDGDIGTQMYIVQSGTIDLVKEVFGREELVCTLEKGDFFGEMAVLENLPRNMGARVREDAEVIAINGATFDKMIKSNIEVGVRMLRKFSARLREADEETLRLRERNRELADLAATGGSPVAAAPAVAAAAPPDASPAAPPAASAPAVAAARSAPVAAAGAPPAAPAPAAPPVAPPVAPPAAPAPAAPPATPSAPRPKAAPVAARAAASPAAAPPPVEAPQKRYFLVVKGTDRRHEIPSGEASIGRADPVTGLRPDIDLTTEDINRFVSRRHAKILLKEQTYYLVEEVGVTNGTYVNGKRLQAGVYTSIHPGDELCFGKVFLTFTAEE